MLGNKLFRKEIMENGSVKVFYYNGDMKESNPSGLVRYLYHESQTWHTKYPDGKELTQFSNGQTEVGIYYNEAMKQRK